jgi:hypothetical protein
VSNSLLHQVVIVAFMGLASVPRAAAVDGAFPESKSKPEIVTINCRADAGPFIGRCSGFLLSFSASQPADDLIKPLRPRLLRTRAVPWDPGSNETGLAGAKRMADMGATLELIVSDDYVVDRQMHGKPPYPVDFAALDQTIAQLVLQARQSGLKAQWDIWNEPDGIWQAKPEEFHAVWLRAYRRLRQLDPQAVIVGPSTIHYHAALDFLAWAHANNVMPDAISWHENDDHPEALPAHVAAIRKRLVEQNSQILPVVCNEILGPSQQNDSGLLICYFAALERAGVQGACHACWADADGKTANGFNQSLDGILTPNHLPRATWWAYRYYAELQGRSLKLRAASHVDGVAAVDWTGRTLHILLGSNGSPQASKLVVQLLGLPASLGAAAPARVHVVTRKIPASGWQALPDTLEEPATDSLVSAATSVVLPALRPAESYYLTITWPGP